LVLHSKLANFSPHPDRVGGGKNGARARRTSTARRWPLRARAYAFFSEAHQGDMRCELPSSAGLVFLFFLPFFLPRRKHEEQVCRTINRTPPALDPIGHACRPPTSQREQAVMCVCSCRSRAPHRTATQTSLALPFPSKPGGLRLSPFSIAPYFRGGRRHHRKCVKSPVADCRRLHGMATRVCRRGTRATENHGV
jgi:hypothetical protein